MGTEKGKSAGAKITDLPEPRTKDREAEKIKGGMMRADPTESGDVTPGPNGGDTG